jgi:hypothetical protein
MTTSFRSALIVGLLIAAVGCGGEDSSITSPSPSPSSPSATSTPTLTGTWAGGGFFQSCAGTVCQPTGTLTLQLTQSGSSLTGSWTGGPSGTVSGSVSGSNVSMTFTVQPPTPDCTFPLIVTATANANLTQMTGTYSTVSCSLMLAGNISLTKQ